MPRDLTPAATPTHRRQAKDALLHPYFDDLDKALVDAMEDQAVSAQLAESLASLATQRSAAPEAAA